jgi:glycosyltransferase involved in cell wall biosynthesis
MYNGTAALIPAANDDYSLFLCVPALAEAFDEVLILDDASEDETPRVTEWLRSRYSHLRAARSERPLGWADARNELAAMTTARHLFFIDADDILVEGLRDALHPIIDSPAGNVRLGLAEMWGDFEHGTGRGLDRPHFDPCHVYVDRALCPGARWTCVGSRAHLSTTCRPTTTTNVLFWHAKGVKSDWRLIARTHIRQWIQAGTSDGIGAWPAFVRDQWELHDRALQRLLHDKVDPIRRLPSNVKLPRVCREAPRFEMVYANGQIADRLDHGWEFG